MIFILKTNSLYATGYTIELDSKPIGIEMLDKIRVKFPGIQDDKIKQETVSKNYNLEIPLPEEMARESERFQENIEVVLKIEKAGLNRFFNLTPVKDKWGWITVWPEFNLSKFFEFWKKLGFPLEIGKYDLENN